MWCACLKKVCDVQGMLRYFTVGVMSTWAFSYLGQISQEEVMEGCKVFKEPQKLNNNEQQSLCCLRPCFISVPVCGGSVHAAARKPFLRQTAHQLEWHGRLTIHFILQGKKKRWIFTLSFIVTQSTRASSINPSRPCVRQRPAVLSGDVQVFRQGRCAAAFPGSPSSEQLLVHLLLCGLGCKHLAGWPYFSSSLYLTLCDGALCFAVQLSFSLSVSLDLCGALLQRLKPNCRSIYRSTLKRKTQSEKANAGEVCFFSLSLKNFLSNSFFNS